MCQRCEQLPPFGAKIYLDICPDILFQEAKTVILEEQIMSKDKICPLVYSQIFDIKVKWRLLCLISFKYVLQHAGSFENWGTSLGYFHVLAGALFSHTMHLDQLSASDSI